MLFYHFIIYSNSTSEKNNFINFQNLEYSILHDKYYNAAKFSPIQDIIFKNLNYDISPVYNIVSYILDPFNLSKCYIFVENTLSKEIRHYTIFLEDHLSVQNIKNNILFETINVNYLFTKIFTETEILEKDSDDFAKILSLLDFDTLNLFTLIIQKMKSLLLKLDHEVWYMFYYKNYIPVNNLYYKRYNLYHKIKSFINVCKKIHNMKIEIYYLDNINDTITSNLKTLDLYISNRVEILFEYINLSNIDKFNRINQLTDSTYHFCLRHNIAKKSIIRFTFTSIKAIENKLYQFTLILCWINLTCYYQKNKNVYKMLKLAIYIFINKHINNNDINNQDSLYLLHCISKTDRFKPITNIILKSMCFLEQPHSKYMQNIIIKRFFFFITQFNDENSYFLRYLILDHHKFESTWIFIKCCIITHYKIFNMVI